MPIAVGAEEDKQERLRGPSSLLPFNGLVERFLPLEQIRDLCQRAQRTGGNSLLDSVLAEMEVSLQVGDADLGRIPSGGPVLVVSNHPFGLLDGTALGALLFRVRSDVKIIANFLLAGFSDLQERCIFVDPYNEKDSIHHNRTALREALTWLREGHMLAVFPAGEVSHWNLLQGDTVDPRWSPSAARLAHLAQSAALPVFFCGRNSLAFQAMGLMHPRLRTAWLLNEFLRQKGKSIEVRIGSPISAATLSTIGCDHDTTEYLRWRTYLLSQRNEVRFQTPHFLQAILPRKLHASVAPVISADLLVTEIQSLPPEQRMEDSREYSVYVAAADQIPNLLQELGRLREITFRAADEGTGKHRDLDQFDPYYQHVLLWNKLKQELVGGYRMGECSKILARLGIKGLYTSTLFRYHPQFFNELGPAMELGRSFVRPEYQRNFAPLLLLWKGIGNYLAQHPETPVLFGAVSISRTYKCASRELIVRFFQARASENPLAKLVRSRRPFRAALLRQWDSRVVCRLLRDLDDLADPIADIESNARGVPILLKQYAKLGGRLLTFNVDRNFSDVLDGLVLVDLRKTDATVLGRYMGKAGVVAFRRYHGLAGTRSITKIEKNLV